MIDTLAVHAVCISFLFVHVFIFVCDSTLICLFILYHLILVFIYLAVSTLSVSAFLVGLCVCTLYISMVLF